MPESYVDKAINFVSSFCHICESVKSIPKHFQSQSSEEAPQYIVVSFAADVAQQILIFVLRETPQYSNYPYQEEKHENLCNTLIVLCSKLCSLHDGGVILCVDPTPGFCAHLPPTQSSSQNYQRLSLLER